jgi:hypothetical protein
MPLLEQKKKTVTYLSSPAEIKTHAGAARDNKYNHVLVQ